MSDNLAQPETRDEQNIVLVNTAISYGCFKINALGRKDIKFALHAYKCK